MITILDLPFEMYVHILRNDCLDAIDLVHFSKTCTHLRKVCRNISNHVWREKFYKSWPEMRYIYKILDREQTKNFMNDSLLSVKCRTDLHKYLALLLKKSYTEDIQNDYTNNNGCHIVEYMDEFLEEFHRKRRNPIGAITEKYIRTTFPIPLCPSKDARPMIFFLIDEIERYPFRKNCNLEEPREIMRYYTTVLIALCISKMYLESESRCIKNKIVVDIVRRVEGILTSFWCHLCSCRLVSTYHIYCRLCRWFNGNRNYVRMMLLTIYVRKNEVSKISTGRLIAVELYHRVLRAVCETEIYYWYVSDSNVFKEEKPQNSKNQLTNNAPGIQSE